MRGETVNKNGDMSKKSQIQTEYLKNRATQALEDKIINSEPDYDLITAFGHSR